MMIRKTLQALLVLAACAAPSVAPAQDGGWTLGISAGASVVREDDSGYGGLRPQVGATATRHVWGMFSIGVDVSAFGLNDEKPRRSDVLNDSMFFFRPQVVGTQTLLVAVQVNFTPVMYLRPAVGFGRHAFASYRFGPGDVVEEATTSHETGLAAGITGGQVVYLSGVPVAVEAVVVRTRGEDSSSPRWTYGLQVGPRLIF